MNAYQKALLHIEKHVYKRGVNKGSAPADSSQRGRTNFRMTAPPGKCVVRFHNTDILIVYENGDVTLNANGYESTPTTRGALGHVLRMLGIWSHIRGIFTLAHRGAKHNVVSTSTGVYVYFDCMKFTEEGVLKDAPEPFRERRIDKAETAALAAELAASGFTAMYKILYATCTLADVPRFSRRTNEMRDKLTADDRAVDWPEIVADFKYPKRRWYAREQVGDAAACWSRIMAVLKQSMYITRETEITVLQTYTV